MIGKLFDSGWMDGFKIVFVNVGLWQSGWFTAWEWMNNWPWLDGFSTQRQAFWGLVGFWECCAYRDERNETLGMVLPHVGVHVLSHVNFSL
jgi:hypothetical protein